MNLRTVPCFRAWLCELLTVPWAAAGVRTAAAADVATAGVRATLAPADPHQQHEQDTAQDHTSHKHPFWSGDTNRQTHSDEYILSS